MKEILQAMFGEHMNEQDLQQIMQLVDAMQKFESSGNDPDKQEEYMA